MRVIRQKREEGIRKQAEQSGKSEKEIRKEIRLANQAAKNEADDKAACERICRDYTLEQALNAVIEMFLKEDSDYKRVIDWAVKKQAMRAVKQAA